MAFKYKYVLFNTLDEEVYKDHPDNYFDICVNDLRSSDDIEVVSAPLYHLPKFFRYLYAIHNSQRFKSNLPLKNIWYPFYFKNRKSKSPFCFILLNHKIPVTYLQYLKNKYPDCRIVVLHRDLAEVCNRTNPSLSGNSILDLEMTYDDEESVRYGWPHFSEFESKINLSPTSDYPESDVFFAGRAKDRFPMLLSAYYKFKEAGLNVHYFLTGVPESNQIKLEGIEYANRNMSYREMLEHTVNTRCVLEINYGQTKGYTSRFLEAVIYGKKLITNNSTVVKSPFYTTGNIKVVSNFDDDSIVDFVKNSEALVAYNYKGEFSPYRLIERIEEELDKKYGEQSI